GPVNFQVAPAEATVLGSIGVAAGAAGCAIDDGAEAGASFVSSFLLQPTRSHRPRRQSRPNIARDVFLFMMSPFREKLNASFKVRSQVYVLSRKLAPNARAGAPSRQPPGRRRYKTLHFTANLRCLPGEKAWQPAWISLAAGLRRYFAPSMQLRVFALLGLAGKYSRPTISTGLPRNPGTMQASARQT